LRALIIHLFAANLTLALPVQLVLAARRRLGARGGVETRAGTREETAIFGLARDDSAILVADERFARLCRVALFCIELLLRW
jgi:hypothetical protein